MNIFGFATEESVGLYYEKRAVRRTANHIGLGLILFFGISLIAQFLLMLVLGQSFITLLNDPAGMLAFNIVLTLLGFLLGAFMILGLEKRRVDSLVSFGRPKKGTFLPAVMVGIGFCYTANIIVSILQGVLSGIMPLEGGDISLPEGPFGFVLGILSVAVFPALLEELLFRGAIMGSLLKFGKPFAIFTSALMFGLVHGNLVQIPFAFLVGLALGFVVVETGSIWTGVLIHFLNNLISTLVQYGEMYFGSEIINVGYMLLLAVMIMLGFFGMYLFSLKNEGLMKYPQTPHFSTAKKRFGWFFGSPAIIVYLVIIGLEILMVQFGGMIS